MQRPAVPSLPRQSVLLSLALGLSLLPSGGAKAQIDRSVDSQGVISISNRSRGGGSRPKKASPQGPSSSIPGTSRAARSSQVIMPSDTSPARVSRYDDLLKEAAALYRLPVAYLRAIMKTESNFDPRVVSPAGAVGLMQLMPFTAERMMVTDIFDPRQNIMGGARYLRILANAFNGDIHLTTAAYNAGEHAVIRYGGIPPYEETQNYVVRVLEHYERYRAEETGSP